MSISFPPLFKIFLKQLDVIQILRTTQFKYLLHTSPFSGITGCWTLNRGSRYTHRCKCRNNENPFWHFPVLPSKRQVVTLFTKGSVLTSSGDSGFWRVGGGLKYLGTLHETIPQVLGTLAAFSFKKSTPLVPPSSLNNPELTKPPVKKKSHPLLCRLSTCQCYA